MANLHILDTTDGKEYNVVAHIAIPNTNNSAGVNWRTVLVNSGIGGKTELNDGDGTAGTISAAEKASIASGAVLEVSATIRADTVAAANLNAYLDAEYTKIKTEALSRLQAQLKFWGATR